MGAFSVITNLRIDLFEALILLQLVRTTFCTRRDQRTRKDEQLPAHPEEAVELQPRAEAGLAGAEAGAATRLVNWVLGVGEAAAEDGGEEKMRRHTEKLASLEQSRLQRGLLRANLVIIVCLAVVLYVVMSINPFTEEQLANFEILALNKTHLKSIK